MNHKLYCLSIVAILLIAVFPFMSASPIEHVDQEQTNCAGAYYATSYPGKLAQSFKPTLNMLTKVNLFGWKNESPPNTLKISIRDSLNSPDLTSVIVQPNQLLTYTPSWFEVDFPNISVIPETTYYIVWSPTEGDGNEPFFWWCYAMANPGDDYYDRGSQILNGEEVERADFCFQTYGYSIPTVTINNPIDEGEIGGIIPINGTAYDVDGSVEKVEVNIDENQWLTVSGTITWCYEWDTRGVSNGAHTIYARSFDGESYSEIVSITVFVTNSLISIEDVSGGFGGIKATICNTGEIPLYGVTWSIKVDGGLFNLIDVETSGLISTLLEDDEISIATDESIIGLGLINLVITVQADNAYEQMIQKMGLIIGPFLILL